MASDVWLANVYFGYLMAYYQLVLHLPKWATASYILLLLGARHFQGLTFSFTALARGEGGSEHHATCVCSAVSSCFPCQS